MLQSMLHRVFTGKCPMQIS